MKLLDGSEYVMDLSQVRTLLFPSIYGPDSSLEKITSTELARAVNDSIMTGLKKHLVTKAIS